MSPEMKKQISELFRELEEVHDKSPEWLFQMTCDQYKIRYNKTIDHSHVADALAPETSYYVLPRGKNTMVKTADYFESQGGLTEDWGKSWKKLSANSIEHARELGSHLTPIDLRFAQP